MDSLESIMKEISSLPSIPAPYQIKEMIEKKKEIIDNMPDWEVRLEFDNLLREINTLPIQSQWIPVEERLPEDGEIVITYNSI
jgi:hypothetical protein